MTIDEAIRILVATSYQGIVDHDKGYVDALHLGIEALEWIKNWRETTSTRRSLRLPGETEGPKGEWL